MGGRKREKETNISKITKFRQRVGNKQQQELWEEGRKRKKETNISKGNNKV